MGRAPGEGDPPDAGPQGSDAQGTGRQEPGIQDSHGQAPGEVLHASTVALDGQGLLILGPSGSGKSSLALQLMALGAQLVADDRTHVWREGGRLMAASPPAIQGMIEARGVGLLGAEAHGPVPLALAVDMGQAETERLPPRREIRLLNLPLPLLHNPTTAAFAAALVQYLRGGRKE